MDPCTAQASLRDPHACPQAVIHVPVNVTLLEKLRLSVTPHLYSIPEAFDHRPLDIELGLSLALY